MPNKFLKALALPASARAVIFHADDIGFSCASVRAAEELMEFGLLSSASVMMPCPWAVKAAELFKSSSEFCAGIHLTLTCEYDYYRWGGLRSRNSVPGLCDQYGNFRHSVAEVLTHAAVSEITEEIHAQISAAIAAGYNPSHIDSHMGTVFAAPYSHSYLSLYDSYDLPLFIPRVSENELRKYGYSGELKNQMLHTLNSLENNGKPVIDRMAGLSLQGPYSCRAEQVKDILKTIEPGTITHFICHPAIGGEETRNITPSWQHRNADYEVFLSSELKKWITGQGFEIIDYRKIKAAMYDHSYDG